MGQTKSKPHENSQKDPKSREKLKTKNSSMKKSSKSAYKKTKSVTINKHLFHKICKFSKPEDHHLKDFSHNRKENKTIEYFHFEFINEISNHSKKFSYDIEVISEKTAAFYNWHQIISLLSSKEKEKCYKVLDSMDKNTPLFLKVYEFSDDFDQRIEKICKEIFILKYLEDQSLENFSRLHSVLYLETEKQAPKAIFIYFEYQDFSLKEILQFRKENKLIYKEFELLSSMKQIIKIFKTFYEDASLVHRDIKLENILFSKNLKLYMISDFSESNFMTDTQDISLKGTPLYMTPENYEAFLKKEHNNKSTSLMQNDIYALGIIFLLMKKGLSFDEMTKESLKTAQKSIENDNSISAKLILNMLEENPETRPTYFSLISKFSNINDDNHPETSFVFVERISEYVSKNSKDLRKKAEDALSIGLMLIMIGQSEKSIEVLNQAKELFISLNEEQRKIFSMFNLGKAYYKINLLDRAMKEINPIFADFRRFYPENDEDISLGLNVTAKNYEKEGRLVDAIMSYEENIILIEKRHGPFDIKIAYINESLGDIYEKMKQNEEACKRWNEAIGILKHGEGYDNQINDIYNKIYKFHPSEMYDEEALSSFSPRGRNSIKDKEDLFVIDKKDSNGFSKGIKLISANTGNELKIPAQIEKSKRNSAINDISAHDELSFEEKNEGLSQILEKSDKNSKNKNIHFVQKDENFEKELLFINNENFQYKTKNTIKFVQTSQEFKRNSLKNEDSIVYQNEFLKIKSTTIQSDSKEYDLIIEIFYENTSKINKISNIYAKIQGENKNVFVNIQKLKSTELDCEKEMHHSIFVKFKALKYEIPVIMFFGSMASKDIFVLFRLPCTLFSKLFFSEPYSVIQFHKIHEIVLEDRKIYINTPPFHPNKGLVSSLTDFFPIFEKNPPNQLIPQILEYLSTLSFKETELKFLFQVIPFELKPFQIQFKILYISFGEEDFQEKKAVFFELIKTLFFLFT